MGSEPPKPSSDAIAAERQPQPRRLRALAAALCLLAMLASPLLMFLDGDRLGGLAVRSLPVALTFLGGGLLALRRSPAAASPVTPLISAGCELFILGIAATALPFLVLVAVFAGLMATIGEPQEIAQPLGLLPEVMANAIPWSMMAAIPVGLVWMMSSQLQRRTGGSAATGPALSLTALGVRSGVAAGLLLFVLDLLQPVSDSWQDIFEADAQAQAATGLFFYVVVGAATWAVGTLRGSGDLARLALLCAVLFMTPPLMILNFSVVRCYGEGFSPSVCCNMLGPAEISCSSTNFGRNDTPRAQVDNWFAEGMGGRDGRVWVRLGIWRYMDEAQMESQAIR